MALERLLQHSLPQTTRKGQAEGHGQQEDMTTTITHGTPTMLQIANSAPMVTLYSRFQGAKDAEYTLAAQSLPICSAAEGQHIQPKGAFGQPMKRFA